MAPEVEAGAQAATPPSATGAQAANGSEEPQAGDPAAQAADPAEPETISLEEARKLRSENRSLRQRLTPLEQAEKDRATAAEASKPELERAQAKVTELEQTVEQLTARDKERGIREAALEAATTLGFRSPALAHKLVDRDEIEYAEDGSPKNVESLLKKVAQADPYLVKDGTPDFGGGKRGDSPGKGPTMNELLRAAGRPK